MKNLIPVCDASQLTEEEYALIRKNTFGASDSSVLCGVNLYKKLPALIEEKKSKFITDAEKEIGKKPAVMKGKDLEDVILNKFIAQTGIATAKPALMYAHKDYSYLTTNFDGLTEEGNIPVECKYVTRWGEKYYKKMNVMDKDTEVARRGTITEHIKYWADKCGIPAYYYTQVQQQIFFADSKYGYLAALFEETWDFKVFTIPRDDVTINHICAVGEKHADEIKSTS